MMKTRQKTAHKGLNAITGTIAAWFAILCFSLAYAQSPAAYNLADLYDFNVKTIYGLYQAKNKHVWIATDQGLYAFNGTNFKKYGNSAYQNEYHNIREDKQGRIWCSNFSGQLFYTDNNTLRLFKDVNAYTAAGILSFTVNRFPELYIGTDYGYIIANFYDQSNSRHFQTHTSEKSRYKVLRNKDTVYQDYVLHIQPYRDGLLYNTFFSVHTLQHGKTQPLFTMGKYCDFPFVLLHNDTVLLISQTTDWKLRIHRYQNGNIQSRTYKELSAPVRYVFYHDSVLQKYWVGTYDGTFLLDKTLQPLGANFHFLKGQVVSGILRDHEGNYWVSTLHSGIYIIPSLQLRNLNSANSPLIKDAIISMVTTGPKQLLLMDHLGNGYEYDITTNTLTFRFNAGTGTGAMVYNPIKNIVHIETVFKTYNPETKRLDGPIIDYAKAATAIDSTHLLASYSAGAYITNFETDSASPPMNAAWQKRYPFISYNGRRKAYPNQLILRATRSFTNTVCQATHTLYVSYSDGLFAYTNDAVEHPITYNDTPLVITALQPATGKGVWAADTEGRLFHILERNIRLITDFGSEIRQIRRHGSTLFLSGNAGIFTYRMETGEKDVINTLDGLPSNTVTGLAVMNDTVYAATLKGLAKIPAGYRHKNTVPPEVELTGISVNGTPHSLDKTLQLGPGENNLSFSFNTYALRSRKTFSYAYRMLGADSSWTTTPTGRVAFTALQPGAYTFQLKAVNEDATESTRVEEVRFTIAPPFYQRWWFYTLIFAATAAGMSFLYTYRIKRIRKQKEMERQLAASAVTSLKAQMNPHFMFNAMNAIQSLILDGKQDEAYDYLARLSVLMQGILNNSEENFIAFTKEMELIHTYLKLEQLRLGAEFEYRIEGAETIEQHVKIPSMIIQPFLENAIKHGLLHKRGAKRLYIVFKQDKTLHCIITDNGIGRKASEAINNRIKGWRKSFSTGAIEKRFTLLKAYYKLDLGFTYTDLEENNTPEGTQVHIKIPILNDDDTYDKSPAGR